jgi:hypothetical protein
MGMCFWEEGQASEGQVSRWNKLPPAPYVVSVYFVYLQMLRSCKVVCAPRNSLAGLRLMHQAAKGSVLAGLPDLCVCSGKDWQKGPVPKRSLWVQMPLASLGLAEWVTSLCTTVPKQW